ncbi:DUF2971 domain-containing protein [Halobacillus fulvus]|nr:DUF2971 domain-containing protein [Halobacillus fulvus]
MAYTKDLWDARIWARSDISSYVTHLTRGRDGDRKSEIDVLFEILHDKKIKGSTNSGYVKGSDPAVCFQDAPLNGIAQSIRHEFVNHEILGGKVRYTATGLMFNKEKAFMKGARPVIYDTKEYAKTMPDGEKWRLVTLDLSSHEHVVDWTHEREWRSKGDYEFDYSDAIVIVSHTDTYREFIKRADKELLSELKGIVNLATVLS